MSLSNHRNSFYSRKRILILGGAGFIGSNIACELVNIGASVTIIDGLQGFSGGRSANIKNMLSEIIFYNNNIQDIKGIDEIFFSQDIIIDSMGFTSHHLGMNDPRLDVELNFLNHLFLLEKLKNAPPLKLIYLGSRAQYGKSETSLIDESSPQNPIDSQGVSKMAAEYYFKIFQNRYKYDFISLRITNCFGENQKVGDGDIGLIGSFIRDLINGKTIELYGDENRTRNILYIKDLVEIILNLIQLELTGCNIFNVVGIDVPLNKLLQSLISLIGTGSYNVKPFPNVVKNLDIGNTKFSDVKLRSLIGPLQYTDLDTSLNNTIKYFKKNNK